MLSGVNMNKELQAYLEELTQDIQNAYESSPTIEEAEKLAAKFLSAQILVGSHLAKADLNARMRKSGLKAIRAAVYMDAVSKADKKPSDTMLENIVNQDEIVSNEQRAFDEAEVYRNELQNYLSVFKDGHIYFRSLAKGRFE